MAINIVAELQNAVRSAFASGGAFDLRCLSVQTAQALGKVDYQTALKAILTACSKDKELWPKVSALMASPMHKLLLEQETKKMHSELKAGQR